MFTLCFLGEKPMVHDVVNVRRANLRLLIESRGASGVAKACGYKSPSYISQMAGVNPTRTITEKIARKIESALGYKSGWLDVSRDNLGYPDGAMSDLSSDDKCFFTCASLANKLLKELRLENFSYDKFAQVVWLMSKNSDQDPIALKTCGDRLLKLASSS